MRNYYWAANIHKMTLWIQDPVPFVITITFSLPTLTVVSIWQRSGLVRLRDLYINNVFCSFSELCENVCLPKTHLFGYFRVRNWAKLNNAKFPNIPPDSMIDLILGMPSNQKGLVSKIYTLSSRLTDASLSKIRKGWEDELWTVIDDNVWDNTLVRVNNSTSCSRLNLIQFNVVHRIYFTNSRLSKIYSNVSDSCNRCHMAPANMTLWGATWSPID